MGNNSQSWMLPPTISEAPTKNSNSRSDQSASPRRPSNNNNNNNYNNYTTTTKQTTTTTTTTKQTTIMTKRRRLRNISTTIFLYNSEKTQKTGDRIFNIVGVTAVSGDVRV